MTTVRIVADGDAASVYDENGHPITGFVSVAWGYNQGSRRAKATLTLTSVHFDGWADAAFHVVHPYTRQVEQVRKIEFASGEVLEF